MAFARIVGGTLVVAVSSALALTPPNFGGCDIFPGDSWWNTPIDNLPVHSLSNTWINSIGPTKPLKADFGSGLYDNSLIGIPFLIVPSSQPNLKITYNQFGDESDPGPFPIPENAPIESLGDEDFIDDDRHVLVLQQGTCMLYELYQALNVTGGWTAGSGAKWNLSSNAFRTLGWTSADAAGLPIFPGLVKYEEIQAGEILHAIRFTVPKTRDVYAWPATHEASSNDSIVLPPMGARFRLKANFSISSYPAPIQVILTAVKKYGLVLADGGSAWYMSGAPNDGWDNDMLNTYMKKVVGSNMEAVDVSSLMISANSGQTTVSSPSTPTTRGPTQTPTSKAPTTRGPTQTPTSKAPTTRQPTRLPTSNAPTTRHPTLTTSHPTTHQPTKQPTKRPTHYPTKRRRKHRG